MMIHQSEQRKMRLWSLKVANRQRIKLNWLRKKETKGGQSLEDQLLKVLFQVQIPETM